jgi:hypothetical protein
MECGKCDGITRNPNFSENNDMILCEPCYMQSDQRILCVFVPNGLISLDDFYHGQVESVLQAVDDDRPTEEETPIVYQCHFCNSKKFRYAIACACQSRYVCERCVTKGDKVTCKSCNEDTIYLDDALNNEIGKVMMLECPLCKLDVEAPYFQRHLMKMCQVRNRIKKEHLIDSITSDIRRYRTFMQCRHIEAKKSIQEQLLNSGRFDLFYRQIYQQTIRLKTGRETDAVCARIKRPCRPSSTKSRLRQLLHFGD